MTDLLPTSFVPKVAGVATTNSLKRAKFGVQSFGPVLWPFCFGHTKKQRDCRKRPFFVYSPLERTLQKEWFRDTLFLSQSGNPKKTNRALTPLLGWVYVLNKRAILNQISRFRPIPFSISAVSSIFLKQTLETAEMLKMLIPGGPC